MTKPKSSSKEKKICNCRGNLNANNPDLPCSSCGGINPMKPPTVSEKEERDKIYQILKSNDATNSASWWNIADEIHSLLSKVRIEEREKCIKEIKSIEITTNNKVEKSNYNFTIWTILQVLTQEK